MPETNIQYIGVDIAKPNFVADLSETTESFEQSPRDFAKFIKRLPPGACVVCEATGGYEQALVEHLCAADIAVAVVMPKRVRFYAKSLGLLAKSDPIDARLLSRYARANPQALRLCQPRSKSLDELRELLRGRDELIELIKTETNRAEHPASMSLLVKQAAARKRLFEKQLAQIEQAIEQVLASDQSLRERAERLQQIQGIGKVSAWTVLAELPELGSLDKGQPACLLGVAPFCQDSGSRQAPRTISGGRARPRRVLYMAAISAARHNPILSLFYQRLICRGKPAKLALAAVMRKLIELMNLVLKYPNFSLAR